MGIRVFLLVVVAVAGCVAGNEPRDSIRLSVMTFNTWGAGNNDGKSVAETVAAIRAADADIVGLQEVRAEGSACEADDCPPGGPGVADAIAEALGYEFYVQRQENDALWANAILSRYPISKATKNDLGVVIKIGERRIAFFNIHLTDYPYQPYQLLGIPYGNSALLDSEQQAIRAAVDARGPAIRLLLDEMESIGEVDAVLVSGDFNEPSHRDWTKRAAVGGRHPMSVRFPTVLALERAGFVDTYRAAYPDELMNPGYTWTPTTAPDDPQDHHDRIDFVLARGNGVTVEQAQVVGESADVAQIVVEPWPSDHRAVVVTLSMP